MGKKTQPGSSSPSNGGGRRDERDEKVLFEQSFSMG